MELGLIKIGMNMAYLNNKCLIARLFFSEAQKLELMNYDEDGVSYKDTEVIIDVNSKELEHHIFNLKWYCEDKTGLHLSKEELIKQFGWH